MGLIQLGPHDYLLMVDLIGAFFQGGGLPVPGAEELIDLILGGIEIFPPEQRINIREEHPLGAAYLVDSYEGREQGFLTIGEVNTGAVRLATRAVFTLEELQATVIRHTFQRMMLWNAHAHNAQERQMHPALSGIKYLFELTKGHDRLVHSYSPFFDDLMLPTGLAQKLRSVGAHRTFTIGLAGDFCAGFCALHAAWEGFESHLIEGWCRNIDLPGTNGRSGTVEGMRQKLDEAGVIRTSYEELRTA